MAQETIVGQLVPEYTDEELNQDEVREDVLADAWLGKFGTNEYEMVMDKDVNKLMKLEMEDGSNLDVTGADVYNLISNSGQSGVLVVTAQYLKQILKELSQDY